MPLPAAIYEERPKQTRQASYAPLPMAITETEKPVEIPAPTAEQIQQYFQEIMAPTKVENDTSTMMSAEDAAVKNAPSLAGPADGDASVPFQQQQAPAPQPNGGGAPTNPIPQNTVPQNTAPANPIPDSTAPANPAPDSTAAPAQNRATGPVTRPREDGSLDITIGNRSYNTRMGPDGTVLFRDIVDGRLGSDFTPREGPLTNSFRQAFTSSRAASAPTVETFDDNGTPYTKVAVASGTPIYFNNDSSRPHTFDEIKGMQKVTAEEYVKQPAFIKDFYRQKMKERDDASTSWTEEQQQEYRDSVNKEDPKSWATFKGTDLIDWEKYASTINNGEEGYAYTALSRSIGPGKLQKIIDKRYKDFYEPQYKQQEEMLKKQDESSLPNPPGGAALPAAPSNTFNVTADAKNIRRGVTAEAKKTESGSAALNMPIRTEQEFRSAAMNDVLTQYMGRNANAPVISPTGMERIKEIANYSKGWNRQKFLKAVEEVKNPKLRDYIWENLDPEALQKEVNETYTGANDARSVYSDQAPEEIKIDKWNETARKLAVVSRLMGLGPKDQNGVPQGYSAEEMYLRPAGGTTMAGTKPLETTINATVSRSKGDEQRVSRTDAAAGPPAAPVGFIKSVHPDGASFATLRDFTAHAYSNSRDIPTSPREMTQGFRSVFKNQDDADKLSWMIRNDQLPKAKARYSNQAEAVREATAMVSDAYNAMESMRAQSKYKSDQDYLDDVSRLFGNYTQDKTAFATAMRDAGLRMKFIEKDAKDSSTVIGRMAAQLKNGAIPDDYWNGSGLVGIRALTNRTVQDAENIVKANWPTIKGQLNPEYIKNLKKQYGESESAWQNGAIRELSETGNITAWLKASNASNR